MSNETWKEAGGYPERFWDFEKKGPLTGIYAGVVTKRLKVSLDEDDPVYEERDFVKVITEASEKPVIVGGRDLLNKIDEVPYGANVLIEFVGQDTFSPKGKPKLKVPINRFKVLYHTEKVKENCELLSQRKTAETEDIIL